MNKLICLLIIVFSGSTWACLNELPLSEAQKAIAKDPSFTGKVCKDLPSEQCMCFDNVNLRHVDIVDEMIPDESKPTYSKNDIEVCVDQSDCESKNASKTCTDSQETVYMAQDFSEIYCSKLTGYEQKVSGRKVFLINLAKKAAADAADAAQLAKDSAMIAARKARNCGETVIDALLVQNASKSLSTAQIKSINTTYASIKDLLETGSLASAREEIQAVTPDGVLVVEADKTALIAQLDSCAP